jgi:hypothetical protein
MNEDPQDDEDEYEAVGWYHVVEARSLLSKLKQEEVEFYIEAPHTDPVNGNVIAAAYGGSFGSGSQVLLYVLREDLDRFRAIHDPAFLGEEQPERKTSLLERIRSFGLYKQD